MPVPTDKTPTGEKLSPLFQTKHPERYYRLAATPRMAKDKSRLTLIKLVSSAKTGFMRYIFRPRSSPIVTQVRYDPLAKRHVLFTESRKRKLAETKKPYFQ